MPLCSNGHEVRLRIVHGTRVVEVAARVGYRGDTLLLCLHGLGCTKDSFDTAFDAAELSGFTICAFDFPSHGDSDRLHYGGNSIEAYADVTLGVIRELNPRRVILVGHSMGGAVALIAAQRDPNLQGLVSVEGNLVGEDCALISRQAANESLEVFTKRLLPEFRSGLAASARRDLRTWECWFSQADPDAIHEAARSLVEWSESGSLLDLFRSLRTPAYVYGQQSGDLSHVLSRLDGVPTYPVAEAAHFPMLDNPGGLWRAVADAVLGRCVSNGDEARLSPHWTISGPVR